MFIGKFLDAVPGVDFLIFLSFTLILWESLRSCDTSQYRGCLPWPIKRGPRSFNYVYKASQRMQLTHVEVASKRQICNPAE